MTLSCNCDMPLPIYWDWLQDQGWDTDEMREEDAPVLVWWPYWYSNGNNNLFSFLNGQSGIGYGNGYEGSVGSGSLTGDCSGLGGGLGSRITLNRGNACD